MALSISTTQKDGIVRLCQKFGVEQLDIFGSATRPDYNPERSDVDFLVNFHSGMADLDNYLALAGGLESLIGRPVDLVIRRAIRNPYFRESVEATRQLVYAHTEQEAPV